MKQFAAAVVGLLRAAPQANASWYLVESNCTMTIGQMSIMSGGPATIDTPEKMMRAMNASPARYPMQDVTYEYPNVNPNVVRIVSTAQPDGSVRYTNWVSNLATCYDVAQKFMQDTRSQAHPSPYR